jgi:hypothetical protein
VPNPWVLSSEWFTGTLCKIASVDFTPMSEMGDITSNIGPDNDDTNARRRDAGCDEEMTRFLPVTDNVSLPSVHAAPKEVSLCIKCGPT